MYQGYRIKINGTVFPNGFIAKGTYQCVEKNRVIETWTDADYVEHKICTGNKKAVISFNIREHNSSEHSQVISFLRDDDNITVEYYSDRTDSYKTGVFRLEDVNFAHITLNGSSIEYGATTIILTEN